MDWQGVIKKLSAFLLDFCCEMITFAHVINSQLKL